MREVLGQAVLTLARTARKHGAGTETALAKVGLPEAELARRGCRVEWERFAAFLTELEVACGGPDGIARVFEQGYPRSAIEIMPMLGAIISPRELFRFVDGVAMPFFYRVVECAEYDLREGMFRVEYRIAPPHVGCPAFFHATAGAMRGVPCMFGQPPAEVQLVAGEREATFLVSLPPSRTIFARARRLVSQRRLRKTVEDVEHDWVEMHRQMEQLDRETEARARAETALKAALGALSARAFVVGPDATVTALDAAGEEALANDNGSLRRRLVEAQAQDGLRVLPLGDERGRLVLLHDGLPAPVAPALLTPRETEVIRLLFKGCTYDEIAQALGVSSNTVRSFIRSIYEKLEVNSRTEAVVAALRLRLIDAP